MNQDELRFAAGAIRDGETIVALTGAGVSTASGIPDFRSEDGLWSRYDPMDFHISRFESDPEGFWEERVGMVEELYGGADESGRGRTDGSGELFGGVEPNPAHEALVDLERAGHLDGLITQNIDGLHQAAGSESVVEIHGNGRRVACRDCARRFDAAGVFDRVRDGAVPPYCPNCDGLLKPDVVLFGEQLPEHALFRAHALAERADTFLVVGSSLTVEPAASLPRTASGNGATLVVVNLDQTELTAQAEYDFREDVTEALPRLVDAVTAEA